jgi:secreted PhoX family phosphatase
MSIEFTRKRFFQSSAAVGGGLLLGGPFAALNAQAAQKRVAGYGPLYPTPEQDSGDIYLRLPRGFKYRVISKQGDPMSDGHATPGIFDGMGAFAGEGDTTVLIRNHENRSRAGELGVIVPSGLRYDPDPNTRGGNTKLVVDKHRNVVQSFGVLAGTHTNCAGGETPWGSWITCEEIFNYGSVENNVNPPGVAHGYAFEIPSAADGPVAAVPIKSAGRFSHEAVAWLDGIMYETEDRTPSCFYRYIPDSVPQSFGDLAEDDGELQALVVDGSPNFNANAASPGQSLPVSWVKIEEPDPASDTVRVEAQSKGAARFAREEGIWAADNSVYFDCTTGGDAGQGQLWRYRPTGAASGVLTLVYESEGEDDLDNPDNVVIVPMTGHVFLQEDGDDSQFVRGVTPRGGIYDFAEAVLEPESEFCGGCFDPDGTTLFLNQQGDRQDGSPAEVGSDPANPPAGSAAYTYAIWGPFARADRV